MTQEPVIRIEDLHHSYGSTPIYRGLDLRIEAGSVFGLLGKNGVGKSTLINILMGYLRPRRGRCLVFGEPSHDLPPATRRRIALLYEGFVSYDFMTIEQVESFFSAFYADWKPRIFRDLVALMELPPQRRLATLSCGQKSQVILGLLLAQDADLLILDDYSMGLDAGYRRLFIDYLRDYLHGTRKTILITSHVMSDLEKLTDRIAIVDRTLPVYQDSMENFCRSFRCYTAPGEPLASDKIHRRETLHGQTHLYSFAPRAELEREIGLPLAEIPLTFEEKFLGYAGKY